MTDGQSSLRCRPRRADSSSNSRCAATRRSAASRTSTAWLRSPDTRATPMPARRYRSWEPVSAADTLNLRCSSATTGRITDRFFLSDCTSPSNLSDSGEPIHIPKISRKELVSGLVPGAEPGLVQALVAGAELGLEVDLKQAELAPRSCPGPTTFPRFAGTTASPLGRAQTPSGT